MEAVLLLDQRRSRSSEDRVEHWVSRLNRSCATLLTLPFERTAGDEMQGVTSSPAALVRILVDAVEDGGWWVGVGIGSIERPLGRTSRESRGPAFWLAREALEKAKSQRAGRAFALRGEPPVDTANLSACLHALGFIIVRRTKRQSEVAQCAREGLSVAEIANRSSVTPQAIRRLLLASGAEEEWELGGFAVEIASSALECTAKS
ncbi:MAG: SatD family protein [Solirubrobacterales bacterium]